MMESMQNSGSYSNPIFPLLRDLIHSRTGIYYNDDTEYLLVDKLSQLVESHGFDSLFDYYFYLRHGLELEQEWRKIESALAVNESYFWREADQIQAAANLIIPELQECNPGRPVRIWHAGCATGEEPFSMAIALAEANRFAYSPIEIIGTDFNSEALARAERGVYRSRSFRSISPTSILNYFTSDGNDNMRLSDKIRSKVKFRYLNLMDDAAIQSLGEFDIIFCRNVFIYFSKESIQRVVSSFYRSLRPSRYLFIGVTESLNRIVSPFELIELDHVFAYQKPEGSKNS